MRFSERNGYKPVRDIIQKENIDDDLKNAIWSLFDTFIWDKINHNNPYPYIKYSNVNSLIHAYWFNLFKKPTDTIPSRTRDSIKVIRDYYFNCKWHEIYSFIEESLDNFPSSINRNKESFTNAINKILERENSAYRILNNQIIEVTSEQ